MQRSESISELAKALAEYHKEAKQPKKDANNPFFKSKYVPLDNIIDVSEKTLANHGLSVIQWPTTTFIEGHPTIEINTMLLHSSGEFIIFDPMAMIPENGKPQAFGSAPAVLERGNHNGFTSIHDRIKLGALDFSNAVAAI